MLADGALHHNDDIIHEKGIDFNVYFRQIAKLCEMADGHLSFCAKPTKTPLFLCPLPPPEKAIIHKAANWEFKECGHCEEQSDVAIPLGLHPTKKYGNTRFIEGDCQLCTKNP